MIAVVFSSLFAALLFIYLFMPAVWQSIIATDDTLDAHESGLAVVAARNPFRESGPPANMAKLILLRHKIQTANRKRRSSSHSRQPSRTCNVPQPRQAKAVNWIRFGRGFGGKQYH